MRGAYATELTTLDPDNDLFSSDTDRNRSHTDFYCRHKFCDRTYTDRAGSYKNIHPDGYKNACPDSYKDPCGLAKFRLPDG